MAKLVYKGKINSNDVVYKERCFHGTFDRFEGDMVQNIMEVVTKNGKKFRLRSYNQCVFITNLLAEGKEYQPDSLNRIIIEEEGKKTLHYSSRNINYNTVEGMRIKNIFDRASTLYDEIRHEIMDELKEKYPKKEPKPEPKKLEKLVISQEEKGLILEEVNELFDTGTKIDTCIYKDDSKKFIKFFSKIEDKSKKKELLNVILKCDYESKEVIEWLNEHEAELLREVGFNG